LLNCSCLDAAMDGDRIASLTGWQLTTQTFHHVRATTFIDCSGDSILAPLSGAACRWGRESSKEFGEYIAPVVADRRTMGNTLLIQARRTETVQRFIPPPWAHRFTGEADMKYRMKGVNARNFWWIEVGGINDTIADAEQIRDELMKYVYGVWDYMKNVSPEKEKAAQWELAWIGILPGKRENRRYEGDHILTQGDVESGGVFEDTVAYGGWSMDDHHPAGLLFPGPPTIHHPAPSPYGIPYRCLYSRNIDNLMFAGRNISVTHTALSSTRVMGTCAVLGQAAGTSAAMAVGLGTSPRGLGEQHLGALQQVLMDDDCFLPGKTRESSRIAQSAELDGGGVGLEKLLDGMDRDRPDAVHAWEGELGEAIVFRWDRPTTVGMLRCTFDSNLANAKLLPCMYPVTSDRSAMPGSLVRAFRVEVMTDDDAWETVARVDDNLHRVVRVRVERDTRSVRLVPEATWGDDRVRVFGVEPAEVHCDRVPPLLKGCTISELRGRQDPADLVLPAKAPADTRQRVHSA